MSVILVPVHTEEEERLACAALRDNPSSVPVAPVLDRDGHLERLERVLRANGLDVVRGTQEDLRAKAGDDALVAPGVIVASPGVEPALTHLAAAITGAPILHLPLAPGALGAATQARRASALWLFEPEQTPPDEALEFARLAAAEGVTWGMVYASHSDAGRFSILKTLLAATVLGDGDYKISSSAYRVPGEATTPVRIGAGTVSSVVETPRDVLVLAGHANMLDAWIGNDAVYCARDGYDGVGLDQDLASCFNGGRCYRQPPSGPERERVGVTRTRAKVVVLSGCNVLPLGRGWCRTEATLAYQTGQGDTLAMLAPSVVSMGSFELDLLCVALVLDGTPLGKVVAEINRVRRDELGQPTGLAPGLGPFVLMGNPELRLVGQGLAGPAFAHDAAGDGERWRIALPPAAGAGPTLLRVPLPRRDRTPHVTLESAPAGAWAKGLWYGAAEADEAALYLYASADASEDANPALEITIRDVDASAVLRNTLAAWWSTFEFWGLFLRASAQQILRANGDASGLTALRDDLPRLVGKLASLVGWLRPPPGLVTLADPLVRQRAMFEDALDAWSRRTLEALVRLAQHTGRVDSTGNPPFLHLAGPLSVAEACPCGGQMFGQTFAAPAGATRRVHRQCHLCGNSRDDDGADGLRWSSARDGVAAGEVLRCRLVGRAPEDRALHVHFASVLETWEPDLRVVGSEHHAVYEPGAQIDFSLEIEVPAELVPGVYPVGILGVANGSLVAMRRSLPFSAAG